MDMRGENESVTGGMPEMGMFRIYTPMILSVVMFGVFHVIGRACHRMGYMPIAVSDFITLLLVLFWTFATIHRIHRAYRIPSLTFFLSMASFFLVVGQTINVINGISALDGAVATAGLLNSWVLTAKEASFVTGLTMMLVALLLSLLQAQRIREALQESYHTVEKQVIERTRELRTANDTLKKEIDERVRAEKALRESESKFRALVENSTDAVLRLDEHGRLLYANHTAVEFFPGLTRNEHAISGNSLSLSPGGAEKWERTFAQARDAGCPAGIECAHAAPGVEYVDWQIVPEPKTGEEGSGTVLAIGRDVTEKHHKENEYRNLQKQVQQKQKMESLGLLAGGIAHDFNNILQVVIGYLELVLKESEIDQNARWRLEHVDKASKRAASLVGQLLSFSRRGAVMPRRIDLFNEIIGSLRLLDRIIGEEYKIRLGVAERGLFVYADPTHVYQIVMNLCLNSRDAMSGGGDIHVRLRRELLAEGGELGAEPGNYAVVSVSDTGTGMPPEVVEKIFDPFFTTKDTGKGTGLGLPTVYGIVRQYGGFIRVFTEPGVGTEFQVFLPESTGQEGVQEETEKRLSPPAGMGARILVAEDDPEVLEFTGQLLEGAGYRVTTARDGTEALNIIESSREPFDLHILDFVMPGITGGQVWERLRKIRPDACAVFISGYSERPLPSDLLSDKTAVLVKPVSPAELLGRVRSMLAGG